MNCHWEEIKSFRSLIEFERFLLWLENQVKSGQAIEIPVESRYAGEMIPERCFICTDCGTKWQLVYPDHGYYPGAFLLARES